MSSSSLNNELLHDCCICMEIITDTNKTTTECGHTFHSSCIFRNLSQRIECPMCRKELIEPTEEELDDEDGDDDEDDDDDSNYSFGSGYSFASFQFQSESGEDGISEERCAEFKKYALKRDTDPVITYNQIADKMMQLGVTPADLMALYCTKIAEIHTETEADSDKYCPKKIHDIDILYRKIARGEIAVNYRDQRSYVNVVGQQQQSQSNNNNNNNNKK